MDDFFFTEYEDAVPREDVRLLNVDAHQDPGTRIIRLALELTPFMDRPSLDIRISNEGKELASTSLVEVIRPKNEFVMHLRVDELPSEGELKIVVYYLDIPVPEEGKDYDMPLRQVVDSHNKKIKFDLSEQ